jgi:hypothetical protein
MVLRFVISNQIAHGTPALALQFKQLALRRANH